MRRCRLNPAMEPFPLISVGGSPRERGRQYGKAAADRVRHSARIYLDVLHRLLKTEADIDALIGRLLPQVNAFGAEYIDEMHGIAEGAELPFAHVFLINARTEIVSLAHRRA